MLLDRDIYVNLLEAALNNNKTPAPADLNKEELDLVRRTSERNKASLNGTK